MRKFVIDTVAQELFGPFSTADAAATWAGAHISAWSVRPLNDVPPMNATAEQAEKFIEPT